MPIDVTELEKALAAQNEKTPFSGVISIREKGESLLARGYGLANRADSIPNTVHTRFGTASGAKTFTSVAICQLVEKGLLTFDTALKEILDIPFPQFDPVITIHHLLTHSAGNPDYFDEETMDDYEGLWKDRPMYSIRTPSDYLPMFQFQPMKFKPGERWAYSNAGFILLGLVLEHLTGVSYPQYIEENIFRRCEMYDSGFFRLDRLPERTAYGYIEDGEQGWRTNFYAIPVIGGPDGGAFTTAPDMSKFWQGFMSDRLLSQETVEKMLTPYWQAGEDSPETYYGYGIWMEQANGSILAYYLLGEDPGAAFLSARYPLKGIEFTILGNLVPETWDMFRSITPYLKAA